MDRVLLVEIRGRGQTSEFNRVLAEWSARVRPTIKDSKIYTHDNNLYILLTYTLPEGEEHNETESILKFGFNN